MRAEALFSGLTVLSDLASSDLEITGVATCLDEVKEGGLFVCIKGTSFDGHTLIGEAFARGACLALGEKAYEGPFPYVRVKNSREALFFLLSNWYGAPEKSFRFTVGITGTNGKTSTAHLLSHILKKAGHRVGVIGTTGYAVGDIRYPLSMTTPSGHALFSCFEKMRSAGCDALVMEVSSHALSQKRVAGLRFTLGIFTNLTQDHLDYHGTMEAYRAEKEKLFSQCETGLVNRKDAASGHFLKSAKCPVYTFGTRDADFYEREVHLAESGSTYRLSHPGGETDILLPLAGEFNVSNSVAAAAAALLLGISPDTVAAALTSAKAAPGRLQRLKNTGDVSVYVDFAHTPDALERVLSALRPLCKGRLYTVFGCGGDRDRTKRPIMGEIACRHSDVVVLTSDNPRTEDPLSILSDIRAGCAGWESKLTVLPDRTEAIRCALERAEAGDTVLLAGKGHEEYIIDASGKHPYSEAEVVRQFYLERQESVL